MKIRIKDVVKFKELILRKGYTQRGFGRAVGISEPYANQIANGERNPGPKVAKNICKTLGSKFDDIFFIDCADSSKQEAY